MRMVPSRRFRQLRQPTLVRHHRRRWIRRGGYARASGLVGIPDALESVAASPLLCAGITTYNALQLVNAGPDALVAIQGIGGFGHLGVQYANMLGYRVAAIARGTDKADLARELGADHYIDSAATDPAEALQDLGGAAAIVATASSGASMSPLLAGWCHAVNS